MKILNRKKTVLLVLFCCLVLMLGIAVPAFAGGMVIERIPTSYFFGGDFFNRCYNNGEGEEIINLTGFTQYGMKEIKGGYIVHINAMQGSGIGEKSGDRYQFNGNLQEVVVKDGESSTLIHNVKIVSNQTENSYRLTWRLHFRVTPDGQLVVNPEVFETTCTWE